MASSPADIKIKDYLQWIKSNINPDVYDDWTTERWNLEVQQMLGTYSNVYKKAEILMVEYNKVKNKFS